ncbi:hypothetical protein HPB50_009887 [Hyalomma asiaticum]|uniref:Uncharacterized protein n=1 Tax=Hyalomma asiaticum TaxID=266040 RepID=A0ACB7RI20_HYAAI|nr:hypothetical protein HPB50_009887 [Hyalomma asiaticum]
MKLRVCSVSRHTRLCTHKPTDGGHHGALHSTGSFGGVASCSLSARFQSGWSALSVTSQGGSNNSSNSHAPPNALALRDGRLLLGRSAEMREPPGAVEHDANRRAVSLQLRGSCNGLGSDRRAENVFGPAATRLLLHRNTMTKIQLVSLLVYRRSVRGRLYGHRQ